MEPKLAVVIGRNLQTPDCDALDASLFGFDQDGRSGGRQPQYFKTQGWHNRALGLHYHRHPPDNAVTLGLDAEKAAPGGRLLQNRNVAEQSGKIDQETLWLLAEHRDTCRRKRFVEFGEDLG